MICKAAKVGRSPANFIAGRSSAMQIDVYDKIAASEGVSICELLGEVAPAPETGVGIDQEAMIVAVEAWNAFLESQGLRPEFEAKDQARMLSGFYTQLAWKSGAEQAQWLQREINNLDLTIPLVVRLM